MDFGATKPYVELSQEYGATAGPNHTVKQLAQNA